MKDMARKNLHIPDEVVRLIGNVLHTARFRSETQAVIAMLEGAHDRLTDAEGYVYLMRGPKGLKIGTSIQPHARATVLKSELLHCIHGDRLQELAVHMIWGRYRVTGEWFQDIPEIESWFANHEDAVPLDQVSDTRNRNSKTVTMTLPADLLDRLDSFIQAQEFPPSRGSVIDAAIACWLENEAPGLVIRAEDLIKDKG